MSRILILKSPGAAPGDADDYQSLVNESGTPFTRTDAILLYPSQLGKYPEFGPQQVVGGWMTEHLNKIGEHIGRFVPDPDYAGLIFIDYFENFDLLWDRTPAFYQDAWIAVNGAPGAEAAYEAAIRAFFEATVARVKALRPSAQVGLFPYPTKFYLAASETAPGVIGYGNGEYLASDRNDSLSWLWDLLDFLCPNVYCLYKSVDDPDHGNFENTPEQDAEYVRSNTAEAVRLADGKPVYVVIHYKYQRSGDNPLAGVYLNEVNFANQMNGPIDAGATGVALWGSIEDEDEAAEVEAYLRAAIGGLDSGDDDEEEEADAGCGAIGFADSGCDGEIGFAEPCCPDDAGGDDDDDDEADDDFVDSGGSTPNPPIVHGLAPDYTMVIGDPTSPDGTWDGSASGPHDSPTNPFGLDFDSPTGLGTVNNELRFEDDPPGTGLTAGSVAPNSGTSGFQDGVFIDAARSVPEVLINGNPSLVSGVFGIPSVSAAP